MSESITVKTFERDFSFVEKLVRSKLFWFSFILLSFAYPLIKSVQREIPEPAPAIFQVPSFKMINEFGKPFGSDDLKGRIYIANFMFTSCPSVCPELMKTMQVVQKRVRGLGTKVALVTFTVDPETDTSAVLYKYSRELKSNPHVWTFLTGTVEEMKALLVGGFKVPMEKQKEVELYDIAHSQKLVLVDGEGGVRSYHSTDKVSLDQMMIELGILVNKKKTF
jgi:protein SCO1